MEAVCVAEKWKKGTKLVLDRPGNSWHGKQVKFLSHIDHAVIYPVNGEIHCCTINLPGKWGGPCVERAERLKPAKTRP